LIFAVVGFCEFFLALCIDSFLIVLGYTHEVPSFLAGSICGQFDIGRLWIEKDGGCFVGHFCGTGGWCEQWPGG
jgi:hypothetical protein